MISNVKIANLALLRIGEKPITVFGEAGNPGTLANETYEIYRDGLLRQEPWHFAIRRASLAESTTGPVWEFDCRYPLPSNPYCLRVLTIENLSDLDWRVEGRAIITDASSPINVKYIARITDPNEFDALFVEALAAKLALEWADRLFKDNHMLQVLASEYAEKMRQASAVNGTEGKLEPLPWGSWVDAHLS